MKFLCFTNLHYRQAIIEQERRDRELALRLVAEDQNQVEDVTLPPLTRYCISFIVNFLCN